MIEVIEQTTDRAKLDHDLIVPITNHKCQVQFLEERIIIPARRRFFQKPWHLDYRLYRGVRVPLMITIRLWVVPLVVSTHLSVSTGNMVSTRSFTNLQGRCVVLLCSVVGQARTHTELILLIPLALDSLIMCSSIIMSSLYQVSTHFSLII